MMNEEIKKKAQSRLDSLIKPVGSFASLETMAVQAAGAQNQEIPEFFKKKILSFSPNEPSKTLKVLARYIGASLDKITPAADCKSQAEELAVKLADEGIGIVGISLPDWQEEEVYKLWEDLKNTSLVDVEVVENKEKITHLKLASSFYQAAAAKRILIMLDGPASLLTAVMAGRQSPWIKEYLISSRDKDLADYREMQIEMGLDKGMSTGIIDDGGLSMAFGLSLFDAAIRGIREIATFAEAQVEYAYNAASKK
jgi:Phosphoribosyltransferase.